MPDHVSYLSVACDQDKHTDTDHTMEGPLNHFFHTTEVSLGRFFGSAIFAISKLQGDTSMRGDRE